MTDKLVRRHDGAFHWEGVDVLQYKQEGSAPFKDVTRQVLFDDPSMATQLRYFEVAPGGWTTLERHEHVHNVMVIRGKGRCLVGDEAWDLAQNDLVSVPPHDLAPVPRRAPTSRSGSCASSTASATGRNSRTTPRCGSLPPTRPSPPRSSAEEPDLYAAFTRPSRILTRP